MHAADPAPTLLHSATKVAGMWPFLFRSAPSLPLPFSVVALSAANRSTPAHHIGRVSARSRLSHREVDQSRGWRRSRQQSWQKLSNRGRVRAFRVQMSHLTPARPAAHCCCRCAPRSSRSASPCTSRRAIRAAATAPVMASRRPPSLLALSRLSHSACVPFLIQLRSTLRWMVSMGHQHGCAESQNLTLAAILHLA